MIVVAELRLHTLRRGLLASVPLDRVWRHIGDAVMVTNVATDERTPVVSLANKVERSARQGGVRLGVS
jgi:hypothetical protein